MNPADLSWPEDPGYDLRGKPMPVPEDDLTALNLAMAQLALAGSRRNRYGALAGRDPDICAQLNDETTQAQQACDDARAALLVPPEVP